jgi:hypothetical protein
MREGAGFRTRPARLPVIVTGAWKAPSSMTRDRLYRLAVRRRGAPRHLRPLDVPYARRCGRRPRTRQQPEMPTTWHARPGWLLLADTVLLFRLALCPFPVVARLRHAMEARFQRLTANGARALPVRTPRSERSKWKLVPPGVAPCSSRAALQTVRAKESDRKLQ